MRLRQLLLAASLLAGSNAALAAGGPPIAYVKGSGIYLTNQDGTGTVRLHAVSGKRTIGALDLKPSGNEIAFFEIGTGVTRVIKILSFSDSGTADPAGPRTLSGTCAPDSLDYHPTEAKLIISETCNGTTSLATIGTDGSGYTPLIQGSATLVVGKPRWLNNGLSYVYYRSVAPGLRYLCRSDDENCSSPILSGVAVVWMDVARTSNDILFTSSGSSYVSKVNADTGEVTSNIITGTDGHFSPTDRYVLFESPHLASGDYLHVKDLQTLQQPRITGKGDYGAKDWRN